MYLFNCQNTIRIYCKYGTKYYFKETKKRVPDENYNIKKKIYENLYTN